MLHLKVDNKILTAEGIQEMIKGHNCELCPFKHRGSWMECTCTNVKDTIYAIPLNFFKIGYTSDYFSRLYPLLILF